MDQSFAEDWPLPGMGPESLTAPSLEANEGNGSGRKSSGKRKNRGDERIAPLPSQATRAIPADVELRETELELFEEAKVLAVLQDEKVLVFDKRPQPSAQGGASSSVTFSANPQSEGTSTHTMVSAPHMTMSSPPGIAGSFGTTPPPFYPERLSLKVLLPVCTTLVSIFWLYTASQLDILAETQPLVVLLVYAFQPLRPANAFTLFRAAYLKAHPGGSKEAGKAWKALPDAQKTPWKIRFDKLKEASLNAYPGYIFHGVCKGKEEAIRKALEGVEKMIAEGANSGMSPDFIHDLTVVKKAAGKKLKQSEANKKSEQKRKGKVTSQENAQYTEPVTVDSGSPSNKRKRSVNVPSRQRKTTKTTTADKPSKASRSTPSKTTSNKKQSQMPANAGFIHRFHVPGYNVNNPPESSSSVAMGFNISAPLTTAYPVPQPALAPIIAGPSTKAVLQTPTAFPDAVGINHPDHDIATNTALHRDLGFGPALSPSDSLRSLALPTPPTDTAVTPDMDTYQWTGQEIDNALEPLPYYTGDIGQMGQPLNTIWAPNAEENAGSWGFNHTFNPASFYNDAYDPGFGGSNVFDTPFDAGASNNFQ